MRANPEGIDKLISSLEGIRRSGRASLASPPPDPPLPPYGHGGTPSNVPDEWKASVDRQLSQLHDDVRRVTGWIITGIAVPMLAIIGLYVYTGTRFDGVQARFDTVQTKFEALDQRLTRIEVHEQKIDDKLDLLLERSGTAKKTR